MSYGKINNNIIKITPSFNWMVLSDMHFGRNDGNDNIFDSLLARVKSIVDVTYLTLDNQMECI